MEIIYGEKYLKELTLINDTSDGDCFSFQLPIFQVTAYEDGQHFIQLFGITKEDPTLKFGIYFSFMFRDFEPNGNNDNKKILDILYIQRSFKSLKFDLEHKNFLTFLERRFKTNTITEFEMKDMVEFRYICLSDNLITYKDFFENQLKLKLFHKDPYFELFVNIDFPNKKVEFSEKDEEYRQLILKSLAIKK